MDSIDFAGKRVLLASLLPDTGHLIPLFQIAGALEERGAKAYPIAPDEAKDVVGRFPIDAEYLGEVVPGQVKVALTANVLMKFNELVDITLKFSPDYWDQLYSRSDVGSI
jgi:UDP:flavonoid glycosyltransferase YjiC (YdhE family)